MLLLSPLLLIFLNLLFSIDNEDNIQLGFKREKRIPMTWLELSQNLLIPSKLLKDSNPLEISQGLLNGFLHSFSVTSL